MSFRIQLLLAGLAVLAVLGARWWWLARKADSETGDGLQALQELAPERIDPVMSVLPDLAGDGLENLAHFEPSSMPVGAISATSPTLANSPEFAALTTSLAPERRPVLHPQIDCIAMLEMDTPCTGEFALSLMPATRRIGSKTWRIEGLNATSKTWESVTAGQTYDHFQAGIQLVNRNGALNDVEFSEFVAKASQLADSLGASTDFPEMMPEVARARELEQFVQAHDIRLSLHLHAKRAAWSLPYVQQHAQRAGFVAGVIPGRWVLVASEHELIALTIDPQAAMADETNPVPIRQLTLVLDVPQVARADASAREPFDLMCDLAIRLCAGMEAVMVDEQGLAVDAQALQRTAQELQVVYDRLDEVGLSAGSPLARRLFS